MAQCIFAVFFHIPADIYQTPNVFGVRLVMVPAYGARCCARRLAPSKAGHMPCAQHPSAGQLPRRGSARRVASNRQRWSWA